MGCSVTRTFSRREVAIATALSAAMCTLALSASAYSQEGGSRLATIAGRLATVEPANRRITLIPRGEVELFEIFVAEAGELRLEDQRLTLADLVIQVGRRITVSYRTEGVRHVAERIIVEPD